MPLSQHQIITVKNQCQAFFLFLVLFYSASAGALNYGRGFPIVSTLHPMKPFAFVIPFAEIRPKALSGRYATPQPPAVSQIPEKGTPSKL